MASVDSAINPRAGSHSQRLKMSEDDAAIDPPGGLVAALLMGRPMEAARQGVQSVTRRAQGISNSTADALASRLYTTDPAEISAITQRLQAVQAKDVKNAPMYRGLASRLLQSGGVAAGLSTGN